MCTSSLRDMLQSPFRGKPRERFARMAPLPPHSVLRAQLLKGPQRKKQNTDPLGGYMSEYDRRTALGG